MEKRSDRDSRDVLPGCAVQYIGQVTRKMRYRRRARAEVGAELRAHFEDALKACADAEQRDARARELIEQFGDAKLLAVLCRRAKKRCRPLWRKVCVRAAQGLGVLLLYSALCSLPLFVGRPMVRVNYVEWLNSRWRPAQPKAENAKTYYDEAGRLYVEPPEELEGKVATASPQLEDYNDVELRQLSSWLDENAAALAKLRHGAKTAHYWPVYEVAESDLRSPALIGRAMEALPSYRYLAFALCHAIAKEVAQGNLRGGMDDCFVLRRLGRHLQGRGLLVEQLVGIALEDMAYTRLLCLLRDGPEFSAPMLTHMRAELLTLCDERRCVISLEGEKAFWYDAIQRTFTDDGKGGGHALRQGLPYAIGRARDLLGIFVFDYPDRRQTLAMVEGFFERTQKAATTLPGQADPVLTSQGQDEVALGSVLLRLLPDAYGRMNRQAWALKTHEAAALAIVAIFTYKNAEGRFPDRLEELVETGCLTELPQDPFGQGPLSYEVTDDGFILYSWGEDRRDDGGRLGTGRNGKPRMWADNGDWVFWPLAYDEE